MNNSLKNFILYTVVGVTQKAFSFLLIPIVTRYLSPEEFGIVNQMVAIGSLYVLLFTFALDEAAVRFFHQYQSERDTVGSIIGNVLGISIIIVLLGVPVIFIFSNSFYTFFVVEAAHDYILVSIIFVAASPFYAIYLKILRIQEEAAKFTLITAGNFILQVLFTVLFVVVLEMGGIGYFISLSLSTAIVGVYSFIKLFLISKFDLSLNRTKELIGYSSKILPHTLTSWGLTSFTILYLGFKLGSKDVGIYSALSYLAIIVNVLSTSLLYSYQPWLYRKLENTDKHKSIIIYYTSFFSAVFIMLGSFLSLFTPEIIKLILDDRYHVSLYIAPLIIFASVFLFFGSLQTYILYYTKQLTAKVAIATVVGVIINILFIYLLLPLYGLLGAAISILISQITISLIKLYYSNYVIKNSKALSFYLVALIVMSLSIFSLLANLNVYSRFSLFILFSIIFFFCYKSLLGKVCMMFFLRLSNRNKI